MIKTAFTFHFLPDHRSLLKTNQVNLKAKVRPGVRSRKKIITPGNTGTARILRQSVNKIFIMRKASA